MTEHDTRIRLPDILRKKYKIICIMKNLSIQKQTIELIRKFVEVTEENEKRMQNIGKEK